MTTFIIIFTITAALALLSQVGTYALPARYGKPCSYVGIALHVAVFPLFPVLSIPFRYCLCFYLGSLLLRLLSALTFGKRKGEKDDL